MEKHRRLLFVVGSMGGGGAERVASIFANELSRKGFDITIAMILDNTVYYDIDPSVKLVDLTRKSHPYLLNLSYWISKIKQLHKKMHFDVAISFFLKGSPLLFEALKKTDVKMLARESEDPLNSKRGLITKALLNHYLAKMHAVIFQSEYQRKCFSKKIQEKGYIIHNPVSVPEGEIIEFSKRSNVIVDVGRLIPGKRHDLILRAFAGFLSKNPDYILNIYGDGIEKENLSNLIKELKLDNHAFLKGTSKNLHYDIAKSKIFVLASDFEGQPNALIEAMALGIPVISSRWNGVEDFVQNNINGLVFEKGDLESLIKSFETITRETDLSQSFVEKANQTRKNFSLETIIDKWLKLF